MNARNAAELAAVISAAIAAFESDKCGGSISNLVVRRINRVSGPITAWNSAGLEDCMRSRRMKRG